MMEKGVLLPIAAPSGTGKTTVCRQLIERIDNCQFSVSCTTRKSRDYEVEGKDYYFLDHDAFQKYINENKFVEWNAHFDNYYGTLKSTLEEAIENKKVLLLDIDVNGAINIKKQFPEDTKSIFLKPPSIEELLRRLTDRGTENDESIKVRKARIPEEMEQAKHFDYEVINDNLEHAVDQVINIIKEK